MKKTILVLSNCIDGLYCFRKEVIKAFVDAGYHVVISCPSQTDCEEKFSFFLKMGCELVPIEFERRGMNPVKDVILVGKFMSLIKRIRPFVVLTYTIKPNIYGGIAAAMCHVPVVANVTGLGTALENPGIVQRIAIKLYRIGLSRSKVVFFQNRSNFDFFEEMKIGGGSHILIPGSGVNLEWHLPKPYPKSDGVIKFLFISRIMKDKGIEELCSAFSKLQKKYHNLELHVVGSCEAGYTDILNRIAAQENAFYHGPQADVRPFIEICHCLVHPSYHEGMSNVIQEASAGARPIITTRVPGCMELVADGETGLLCRVKDASSLCDAMAKFVDMPYETKYRMGIEARKKMEREYDRKIVVNSYLREISKIFGS